MALKFSIGMTKVMKVTRLKASSTFAEEKGTVTIESGSEEILNRVDFCTKNSLPAVRLQTSALR